MSEEAIIDLMEDLHKMQTLLDFMINGFAVLATQSADNALRLTDHEAQEVTIVIREMVDKMIKRVEEAFKEQFCKPAK